MKFLSIANGTSNTMIIEALDNIGITKPTNFWIGGMYIQSSLVTKWYWVNGNAFSYTDWYTTTLVTGDNCIRWDYTAAATTNGKWNPDHCTNVNKFICQN